MSKRITTTHEIVFNAAEIVDLIRQKYPGIPIDGHFFAMSDYDFKNINLGAAKVRVTWYEVKDV